MEKTQRRYTGIGSSRTPKFILLKMKRIARALDQKNYILRSGAAMGADTAFEKGSQNSEIFLPFENFNNNKSNLWKIDPVYFEIAKKYEKNFNNETYEEQCFIARDIQQVVNDGIHSDFVVCWTRDGATDGSFKREKTGGTWYAIAIASDLGIPVINLKNSFGISRKNTPIEYKGANPNLVRWPN